MPIEAVIFDHDDTLIDWWGSMDRCLRGFAPDSVTEALLAYCRNDLWHLDPHGTFIWHRNTWAVHHLRTDVWPAALPDLDPATREALMHRFDRELVVEFFDETIPALEALRSDVRLAVLSNNHLVGDEAVRLGFDQWFETWHTAPLDRMKPHPEAFAPALDALGLEPERCLYVGDSVKADALGALSAGLIPVWVDRWNDDWANRPSSVHRIESLAELPQLVADLS
jgi:HAD superfamily hydrolase (TIGR01509 family)